MGGSGRVGGSGGAGGTGSAGGADWGAGVTGTGAGAGVGVVELDARAVAVSVAVVGGVGPGRLGLATPCGGWTLGRLLAHMTGQHYGFAAAARGEGADVSVWSDRPVDGAPAAGYAGAAAEAVAAFAGPGVLEREFWLPEVHPRVRFPGPAAVGFHLLDCVVHAWDVAAALGTPAGLGGDLGGELVDAALAVAVRVPRGAARLVPGAAFGPVVALPAGASRLEQVLALCGRSPRWPER
jgi:uncharacterized protein (TIGR03086 family)